MYSGLLNHCLREATSALRQNKLACRTRTPRCLLASDSLPAKRCSDTRR